MKSPFITKIIKNQKNLPEFYDTSSQISQKIQLLLKAFAKYNKCLLITGAGISTSCGIPDYRSPIDTQLKIGAGQYNRQVPLDFKPVTYASPSLTHFAITQLVNKNKIYKIITQNVDNLHLKALTSRSKLIQIHGNVCKQYCQKCDKLYYRNYYCRDRNRQKNSDHFNGRYCKICNGKLLDSLIFFGQNYKNSIKQQLKQIKSEFTLIVGTSLFIPSIQRLVKKLGSQVHVINIQKINLEDEYIYNHIHTQSDEAFNSIAKLMNLRLKEFKIIYNAKFQKINNYIVIKFYDFQFTRIDCIKEIDLLQNSQITRVQQNQKIMIKDFEKLQGIKINLHSYHGQQAIFIPAIILQKIMVENKILGLQWHIDKKQWKLQYKQM